MKADMRRCPRCGKFDGSHEDSEGQVWHEDCWDKNEAEKEAE